MLGPTVVQVAQHMTFPSIAHAVDRVWPTPGEPFLDIATGLVGLPDTSPYAVQWSPASTSATA
jgi:hypothetical protein